MCSRQDAFQAKFASAAEHLNAPLEHLISLKLREDSVNHSDYQELLRALMDEAGVLSAPVQGDFRGNAYLIANSKTRVIVVEHETGLEILYIAGSVASLVGIVPLILRCWNSVRGVLGRHRPPRGCGIEIRRVDGDGNLIEDHSAAMDVHWAAPLSAMNSALLSAAEIIDAETQQLKQAVQHLAGRVAALEGMKAKNKRTRLSKTKKNNEGDRVR